jgi:hypothetical protein
MIQLFGPHFRDDLPPQLTRWQIGVLVSFGRIAGFEWMRRYGSRKEAQMELRIFEDVSIAWEHKWELDNCPWAE